MQGSMLLPPPHESASDVEAIDGHVVVPVEPVDQLDFRELGRKLWRRKSVILGTAATLMVLAVLILAQLTPTYRATALVMIDSRQPKIVNIDQVLAGLSSDDETVRSEVQVLQSRDLARQTIAKLGLDQNPEFNSELQPRRWQGLLKDYIPSAWVTVAKDYIPSAWATAAAVDAATHDEAPQEAQRSRLVDAFEQRLTVDSEPHSRVIRIGFASKDPRLAAMIVNTLARDYLESQIQAKSEATKRANHWLSDHLTSLRDQVTASEAAVEAFRTQAGLLQSKPNDGKDITVATEELSGINVELVRAQADRAAAEAKLRPVQAALSSNAGAESISAVLQSQLIQHLVEQQARLEQRAAELATQYGDAHPVTINVNAELRGLQRKIEAEVAKVVQGLKNDVFVAQAREAALTKKLEQAKARAARLDEADIHLRALEREASANRSLYANFLDRFKQTSNQSGDLEQPDARIISSADVPTVPTFPKKNLALGLALIIALFAGVVLAFLLEQLDQGFRSMDQIGKLTGFRPLGLIPTLKSVRRRGVHTRIVDRPATPFAEALRSLATKLLLLDTNDAPRTILFASSLPREGKTTVAVSLAYLQASVGKTVAFVDCDLRRPLAHIEMKVPLKLGLVDYLSGGASIDEIKYREPRCGITVIPAGGATRNPAGLLASGPMKALLKALTQTHDVVILDSAPILAVCDALALCSVVDKTVYLVRWARSRRAIVLKGLHALVEARANVAGIVLSRVDVRKHSRYGYTDSGLYYGRLTEYYGHRR